MVFGLALYGIACACVGWALALRYPDPPHGTNPETWRTMWRRRRRQILKRITGGRM